MFGPGHQPAAQVTHCHISLGYEPYDARLRCLAWSLVAALISVNGYSASTPNLGVSRVAAYPAASRAQIRAQIWLLTEGCRCDTGHHHSGDRFRVRSPWRTGSHASSQAAMPAVLSASGRDTSLATTPSGTRRDRSRLRRSLLRSSEFGALPPWTRSLIPRMAKIIPRIFRIMDTSAVTARTLQGMARVRSGQAPAWPLVSDRSVRRDSRVKRDFACPFPRHFCLCSLSCGHSRA